VGPRCVPTGIPFFKKASRNSVGRGQVTGFLAEATTTHPDDASVTRSVRAFSVVIPYLPLCPPESSLPGCVVPGTGPLSGRPFGVDPRFGLQFWGRFEPSSFCAGRAYGALRAGNRDPGSSLLRACRGVPALSGAGCTRSSRSEPPVPYYESRPTGFSWLPERRVFFVDCNALVLKSCASSAHYRPVLGGTGFSTR